MLRGRSICGRTLPLPIVGFWLGALHIEWRVTQSGAVDDAAQALLDKEALCAGGQQMLEVTERKFAQI